LDLQFELTSTFLNDGGKLPARSTINNGHAYLGAPYGIYATTDGFLALAMGSVVRLGELLEMPALATFQNPDSWFSQRDEIKTLIRDHLKIKPTQYWLDRLVPADYWCAEVLNWHDLFRHAAFAELDWVMEVQREGGPLMKTTRCPITIDGTRFKSKLGAPRVGQHNDHILREFHLE
jgi:crotonobetainyl-CoA:carnitine CoA-transferase CaiB-like acyl-CoA transferase